MSRPSDAHGPVERLAAKPNASPERQKQTNSSASSNPKSMLHDARDRMERELILRRTF